MVLLCLTLVRYYVSFEENYHKVYPVLRVTLLILQVMLLKVELWQSTYRELTT